MAESRQQPYWGYVLKTMPKDNQLLKCIAEYLHMRLQKDKQLSMADWQSCLDELIEAYNITPSMYNITERISLRQLAIDPPFEITVQDLRYLFSMATQRQRNHVYITRETEMMYYTTPHGLDAEWYGMMQDPEFQKQVEERVSHGNWFKFEQC